jgi:excisionase family DNA binding protein
MGKLKPDGDSDAGCEAGPHAGVITLDRGRAQRIGRRLGVTDAASGNGTARVESSAELLRAIVRDEVSVVLDGVDALRRDLVEVNELVFDTAGAARFLGVSTKTLLAWVKHEGLPAHRSGREWRFLRSELVQWLQSQRPPSDGRAGARDVP